MGLLKQLRNRVLTVGWQACAVAVITAAELLLLLAVLIPVMGETAPLDSGKPVHVSYLWWSGMVTKPMVFILVSLIGGALGGALHAMASLTTHVAKRDFGTSWTMWYLTNPVVGASLATIFLFVLQAGLGGQAAPTTGGLYGIAAVATLSGLFSRNALNKLKDIFDVAFASKAAVDTTGSGTGVKDTGADTAGTTVPAPTSSDVSSPAGVT